jgi:hypothetical protein
MRRVTTHFCHCRKCGHQFPRTCQRCNDESTAAVLDFINRERSRLNHLKSEVADMAHVFETRSLRFRAVFDAAWSLIVYGTFKDGKFTPVDNQELRGKLREALELADHQWVNFGGVIADPDPRAELRAKT